MIIPYVENSSLTILEDNNLLIPNNDYIKEQKLTTDLAIVNIENTLSIDSIQQIIPKNTEILNEPKLINKLLNTNKRVVELEKFVVDKSIKKKIKKLKEDLAVLQLNSIIKKKDQNTNILNDVLQNIDNKVKIINNVLINNIQEGGTINYKYKYLKYKKKYYELLNLYTF